MSDTNSNLKLLKNLTEQLNLRDEDLVRSERQFRGFFENSSAGMCIANSKTGYFVKVNPALCEWLGYTEQELLSRPMIDFIKKSTLQKTEDILEELAEGVVEKTIKDFVNEYQHKDGSSVWLRWNASVPDESGINYSVCANITKERVQQKIIEQTEEKFYEFFNNGAVGMVMFDHKQMKFIEVNDKFCELIGRTRKEILNGDIQDFLAPQQPETKKTKEILNELSNGEASRTVDGFINAYQKPDGSLVYLSWTSTPMSSEHIQSSVAVDVTTEVRQQQDLVRHIREIEKYKEASENVIQLGVYELLLDGSNEYLYVSDTFKTLFGFSASRTSKGLGDEISKLFEPQVFERVNQQWLDVIDDKIPAFDITYWLTTYDGRRRMFRGRGIVKRDASGNPISMMGTVQDVTDIEFIFKRAIKRK